MADEQDVADFCGFRVGAGEEVAACPGRVEQCDLIGSEVFDGFFEELGCGAGGWEGFDGVIYWEILVAFHLECGVGEIDVPCGENGDGSVVLNGDGSVFAEGGIDLW